jgi:hypothetical protein
MTFWHWIFHALGFDYGLAYGHVGSYNVWSGFGSDIGELAIIGGAIEMFRRIRERHIQKLAQDARHHAETLEQASRHHAELKTQAATHHQEQLDRADVHHEALKAHMTRAAAPPAATRAAAPAARKTSTTKGM